MSDVARVQTLVSRFNIVDVELCCRVHRKRKNDTSKQYKLLRQFIDYGFDVGFPQGRYLTVRLLSFGSLVKGA